MIVLGLTGSIGMGKSTVARMFADRGVPAISADTIVHELYRGALIPAIAAAFPGTVTGGSVDRTRLASAVADDDAALARLEAIVHPWVEAERRRFVDAQVRSGAPLAVLDIPLLFETGVEKSVDRVAVVSCSPDRQRERVLARPGMTMKRFAALLARQMPDADKRARADHVIDTSKTLEATRLDVDRLADRLVGKELGDA